jgi:hypothetical protein
MKSKRLENEWRLISIIGIKQKKINNVNKKISVFNIYKANSKGLKEVFLSTVKGRGRKCFSLEVKVGSVRRQFGVLHSFDKLRVPQQNHACQNLCLLA